MVKLEGMVGKGKAEEEPEGEVITGPSREVVEPLSSGNTPFLLFGIKLSFQSYSFIAVWVSLFFSKTDPSDQNICLPDLSVRSHLFIWDCLMCR